MCLTWERLEFALAVDRGLRRCPGALTMPDEHRSHDLLAVDGAFRTRNFRNPLSVTAAMHVTGAFHVGTNIWR